MALSDSSGDITEYTYDRIGRVEKVTDAENKVVKYEYDDRNGVAEVGATVGVGALAKSTWCCYYYVDEGL